MGQNELRTCWVRQDQVEQNELGRKKGQDDMSQGKKMTVMMMRQDRNDIG